MIKFFKWYKRYNSNMTQYFLITPLPDSWGKDGHHFSFSMYSDDDNVYNFKDASFANFSPEELDKGGMYSKAGAYEEVHGFNYPAIYYALSAKMGRRIIARLFKDY